jgi:hypothetical protein
MGASFAHLGIRCAARECARRDEGNSQP